MEEQKKDVCGEQTETDIEENKEVKKEETAALNENRSKHEKKLSAKELEKRNEELETKVVALEERAKKAEGSSNEFKDKWYRSVAEFDNYRKRNNEAKSQFYENGKVDAVLKFINFGDSIEHALALDMDEKTKEGVTLMKKQFSEIMTSFGITEINPEGEKFDPNFHEAVFSQDAEEGEESGMVKSVFRKGYKLGDKIVRYAQVVVTK